MKPLSRLKEWLKETRVYAFFAAIFALFPWDSGFVWPWAVPIIAARTIADLIISLVVGSVLALVALCILIGWFKLPGGLIVRAIAGLGILFFAILAFLGRFTGG